MDWNEIPYYRLGEVPEDITHEMYRAVVAKRALIATYEDADSPTEIIMDMLIDLRHLCAALGLDFGTLNQGARTRYGEESKQGINPGGTGHICRNKKTPGRD